MPLVSVIIAARNASATVAETLASVLRQTLGDLEAIVVDDGSTDGTAAVAAGTGDRRVAVHTNGGRGVSAARNLGLEVASGRYVAFLDADDLWTPDKLARQRETLAGEPSVAAAYSWTILIDPAGRYVFAKAPSRYRGNVHRTLLMDLFLGSGSNLMIDRERVRGVLEFDESLTIAEDWDFQLRLAREHAFVYVPEYQVLYRLAPGSRSGQAHALEEAMRAIARRELAAEPGAAGLAGRVAATVHEYVALQCLLRARDAVDLRTATAHWAASIGSARRWLDPRAYIVLGLIGTLAVVPRARRGAAVQRLLRVYGASGRRPALLARVAAARGV